MPVVYTKIDLDEVLALLKQRGYGFHSNRQYPLQLNVPSKTRFRKVDGQPHRELLRGITQVERDAILMKAQTIEDAAAMIEALATGQELSPIDALNTEQASSGLSADQISSLIQNRTNLAVTQELAPLRAEIASLKTEMSELLSAMKETFEQKAPKPKKADKQPKVHAKRTDEEVDAILSKMGLGSVQAPPAE